MVDAVLSHGYDDGVIYGYIQRIGYTWGLGSQPLESRKGDMEVAVILNSITKKLKEAY